MNLQHCVLVVDDDPDARESLGRLIQRAGFACFMAEDGAQALGILAKEPVEVILADYDMPGMDGVELLNAVAVSQPNVSRMLLTARQDMDVAVRALNTGHAYRFLNKPCRASELLTAIHFAVEAADQHAETERLAARLKAVDGVLAEVRRRNPQLIKEIEQRLSAAG
ncbi:MAG TPA: response regulator [Myxococcales bacterium]|nr:response regulator [Myxococcales bacterium]